MYFRYKAECVYGVFSSKVEDYSFEIQMYQSHKLKRWKNFCYVSLKDMLLVYDYVPYTRSLETCLEMIKQNGVENIMTKYIKYELEKNKNETTEKEKRNKVVEELNELLISNKWKTINVSVEE